MATDYVICAASWIWLVHSGSGGCVKGPQAATKSVCVPAAPRAHQELNCVLRTGRRKCPSWSSLGWRKKSCWRLSRSCLRRVVPFLNQISSSGDCWGGSGSSAILLSRIKYAISPWRMYRSIYDCSDDVRPTRDWDIDRGTYMSSRSTDYYNLATRTCLSSRSCVCFANSNTSYNEWCTMKLAELLVWGCGHPSPNPSFKLLSISDLEWQLACQLFDMIKV